ncbi:MAG: acetyltransferase [Proteobacteria bacterium]|nr:acetyltransferase [Pseudomonadota bacterium]
MHTEKIFLVGAGGHGKVVLDALLAGGVASERIYVADGKEELAGTTLLGVSVLTPAIQPEAAHGYFHVAIGSANTRQQFHEKLEALGSQPLTIIHPAAVIAVSATIEAGVFVAARAIVAPEAWLGRGSIVNHGAVIDHDCRIGEFCHVAPNATLGGNVSVGKRVLIGAGANILPGIRIGDDVTIGAGAVVIADVPDGVRLVGVPARKII